MIRIEEIWLATEPLDIRARTVPISLSIVAATA